jgi:hypothetical protein
MLIRSGRKLTEPHPVNRGTTDVADRVELASSQKLIASKSAEDGRVNSSKEASGVHRGAATRASR